MSYEEKTRRQPECRSDYHADTGTEPERGHRIVRCGLPPHGRDVKHDEMIDGEAGLVTWDWAPPPPPRSWSLPAEPPDEVSVLVDCDGRPSPSPPDPLAARRNDHAHVRNRITEAPRPPRQTQPPPRRVEHHARRRRRNLRLLPRSRRPPMRR